MAGDEESHSDEFDFYTWGKYLSWASVGLKLLYLFTNLSHYGLQYWFEFSPALILFIMDMIEQFSENADFHSQVWTQVMY